MEEISKSMWEIVPWCMLFADDIVLLAEIKEEVNNKSEEWRAVLEGRGLRLSRPKTKYLWFDFSRTSPKREPEVTIGEQVVASMTKFKYLGLIIHTNGEIDRDITHRIRAGWL